MTMHINNLTGLPFRSAPNLLVSIDLIYIMCAVMNGECC